MDEDFNNLVNEIVRFAEAHGWDETMAAIDEADDTFNDGPDDDPDDDDSDDDDSDGTE